MMFNEELKDIISKTLTVYKIPEIILWNWI